MKRAVVIGAAALLLVVVVIFVRDRTRTHTDEHGSADDDGGNLKSQITNSQPPSLRTPELQNSIIPLPPADPTIAAASNDVRELKRTLGNFLLVLKDPYRPPLGDNRDITRALTGKNRRQYVAIPTNDPGVVNGQLVDRWGTPYWFHPRAPDAIDIISAGPDRELFTPDDIASENFQSLEKSARKIPATGKVSRENFQRLETR